MDETLPTDYTTALTSEIRLGVPKEQSRFKDQPGFDEAWEGISKTLAEFPDAIIEMPGELS